MFFVPVAGHSDRAEAKRAPLPEFKVCNQSKTTKQIATHSYSGRARYTTRGWITIAPKQCADVKGDTVHIARGKRPVELSPRRPTKGCIKSDNDFSVTTARGDFERICKREGGRAVTFYAVRPKTERINLQ
jgi:hypothetical protein